MIMIYDGIENSQEALVDCPDQGVAWIKSDLADKCFVCCICGVVNIRHEGPFTADVWDYTMPHFLPNRGWKRMTKGMYGEYRIEVRTVYDDIGDDDVLVTLYPLSQSQVETWLNLRYSGEKRTIKEYYKHARYLFELERKERKAALLKSVA